MPRLALDPTWPPNLCTMGALSLGLRQKVCDAGNLPPSSAEVTYDWFVPLLPLYTFIAFAGIASLSPWCYNIKYHFTMSGFLLVSQIPGPIHTDYHK